MSAHILHINLNAIFYTHVEHSPTKITCTKHHTHRQTSTYKNKVALCKWCSHPFRIACGMNSLSLLESTEKWHIKLRRYCYERHHSDEDDHADNDYHPETMMMIMMIVVVVVVSPSVAVVVVYIDDDG